MTDISELVKVAEKQSISQQDRYPWNRFLEAFTFIKNYQATVGKDNLPTVTITFKNQYRAKCFLFWLQVLGRVNPYQATVYLEEEVREIYKELK